MKNIIFLCTGNTCRSPMAQAIAEKYISEHHLPLIADSAGLAAFPGAPASENAVMVMREKGADLSSFRAKPFTKEIAQTADFIYCMTPEHLYAAQSLFPAQKDKMALLAESPVSDPYGGNAEVYRKTAGEIEKAVIEILEQIQ